MNLKLIIILFIFSYLGTWFVRYAAVRSNIIDIPNLRSSHHIPTPRGGGIAIALSWYIGIIYLYLVNEIPEHLFFALLCGVPISIIGLLDDIFTISPKLRLSIQFLCAALAVYFLGGIYLVDLGITIFYSSFLINILAVLGLIWFINLFNFLDGIDGYISVETLFICLSLFAILGFKLPLLLVSATAGFLLWNWQPAKIFMGDVGSTLIGFTIGIFALYYQKSEETSVILFLMLSSTFWYDATITLLRRWRNHEHLSKAHKKHAYQRVVQSGFSHQKVVVFSVFINLPIFGLTWLAVTSSELILPLFAINLIYLFMIMKLVDKRFPFQL